MDIEWLKIAGLVLLFVSVFSAVWLLAGAGPQGPAGARPAPEPDPVGAESGGLATLFKPLYAPLVAPVRLLLPAGYAALLKRTLVSAGIDRRVKPEEFAAFQVVMVGVFCLLGWLLRPSLSMVVGFAALGVLYPYWWLLDKKKARQSAITIAMPDMVDMLALSTAAGLDFLAGIKRICETSSARDPFVAELLFCYQNIKLGMSAEEALKTLADRVDTPEMHAFVSILIQAQKMGSSIAEVLKAQSVRMRQDRFLRAERAGAVATQKLLFPLVLCLFPIIFGVIFGPYLLKYLYNR